MLSPYLREAINGALFRGEAWPVITKLRYALFVAGTEVSGGNYSRVEITPTTAHWSDGSGLTTIKEPITFPAPSAAWGVVDEVRVFNAVADGNQHLASFNITPKTINANDDPPVIGVDDLFFNQEPA